MEIAFLSQFRDGERVFRYVDAAAGEALVEVGGSDPLEETFCHYVVRGELPEFLADATQHPRRPGWRSRRSSGWAPT